MMVTVLSWMGLLALTAMGALVMWELGALRVAHRDAERRERRQAAVCAQQLRTSTQHTALPDLSDPAER
ncbi:hypothetical protein OG883_46190 [Streptomyces sp. NBC_01142]|uniref:hypothetical protein n=1 Tax=Streptomyces sp. NBC_01142 TaxID=2975865 RepID=UPI0022559799|nr:hypothetical protein [Streptomyces sp. NBC_01142]MCX4827031.1 hypothetical protein [Streptomyces sp. NBC_01142]